VTLQKRKICVERHSALGIGLLTTPRYFERGLS
jgi:hypothetical protein